MTTHTPGPWIVEHASDHRSADVIRTAAPVVEGATRGVEVARIVNRIRGSLGDYRCNGRLLAAAPDLLAACRNVLARLDLEPADAVFPCSAMRDQLRAAIRVADGDTP
jgi:hypothetical protein